MNTQDFISFIKERTFLPEEYRAYIVSIADTLNDEQRVELVEKIIELAEGYVEDLHNCSSNLIGAKKEMQRNKRKAEEESETEISLPL